MKKRSWIYALLSLVFLLAVGLTCVEKAVLPQRTGESYGLTTARRTEDQTPAAEWVDINTADEEQLAELSGIGPVLARRIVEYRETHGAFTCARELLQVPGIGEKTLEAFQDEIIWEKESDK